MHLQAIEIIRLFKGELEAHRQAILDIYREAFAPAPYSRSEIDVQNFSYTLVRHNERPGWRCYVACEGLTGPPLGFVYGYTSAPGQWWHDLVENALSPQEARKWLSNAFEFAELAVRPRAQGRSAGGRLHDTILAGLSHRTAVLSTIQADTVAMLLYRRRGWVTLLENFYFPGTARPYRIMGLELPGNSSRPVR